MNLRRPFLFFSLLCFLSPLGFAAECTNISQDTNVPIYRCDNLKIIVLRGTPVERAHTYGVLIKSKVLSSDLIHYFSHRLIHGTEKAPKLVRWLAEKAYNWLAQYIFQKVPAELQEEIQAVADGAEMDPIIFKRAVTLPDLSSELNALTARWPLKELPPFGCTSVAKLAGNNFYYGRNLDFSSAGIWDKNPQMVVHIPAPNTTELRHIAFGADGVNSAGITGVNEAGITFAVHQNFASEYAIELPMFFIGELMLREVKNLEEAKTFLEKHRPGPFWTFVVGDLKTGQIMAVESSQTQFSVREMAGNEFTQTNHLLGFRTKTAELIRPALKLNSTFRYEKALQLLRSDAAAIFDPKTIFSVLSYRSDPRGQLSSYNDIIKPHTIQTVIFASKIGENWLKESSLQISEGAAPAATGVFLKFNLADLLQGEFVLPLEFEGQPVIDPNSEVRKNQMLNSVALRQYFDEDDRAAAINTLKNQTSLGAQLFLATAQYQEKLYAQALEVAERALKSPEFLNEPYSVLDAMAKVQLLSLAALERNQDAKTAADAVLQKGTDDVELLEITKYILAGRTVPWRLRKISYDFFSGNIRTMPRLQ